MRVGFIGLGNMGNPMAANVLKAGHSLTVYDLRREIGRNLEEAGAKWAASPKDVAAQSEVVLSSLPGPPEVEAVVLGEDGNDNIDGQAGTDTVAGNQGADVINDPAAEINEAFVLPASLRTLLDTI